MSSNVFILSYCIMEVEYHEPLNKITLHFILKRILRRRIFKFATTHPGHDYFSIILWLSHWSRSLVTTVEPKFSVSFFLRPLRALNWSECMNESAFSQFCTLFSVLTLADHRGLCRWHGQSQRSAAFSLYHPGAMLSEQLCMLCT